MRAREQRCPGRGRVEATGAYCTGCGQPSDTESQRAALAARLAPTLPGRGPGRPSKAADTPADEIVPRVGQFPEGRRIKRAATIVGVSHGLACEAAKLQREAPDLFARVEAGEVGSSEVTP